VIGLPTLLRLDLRELLAVLLDERGEPSQEPRAVAGGDRTPGRERLRRARATAASVSSMPASTSSAIGMLGCGVENRQTHGC
jgi:hypothetical protein